MNQPPYRRRQLESLGRCGFTRTGALLVSKSENIRYLTGYRLGDAALVVTGRGSYLITDQRNIGQAMDTASGCTVKPAEGGMLKSIESIARSSGIRTVGVESLSMPYDAWARLKRALGRFRLVAAGAPVESVRKVKDAREIALISRAAKACSRIMEMAVSHAASGRSEIDIARLIMTETVAEDARPSFEPIVARGPRTAMPHSDPTRSAIAANDIVMIDMGVSIDDYKSDLTRTVFFGKIRSLLKTVYGVVEEAQEKALAAIRAGVRACDVDKSAREVMARYGFAENFTHALGHGIGLETHEQPSLSGYNTEPLTAGMVVTVEPGIYIPGVGGVRIEDMVVVTERGARLLTR